MLVALVTALVADTGWSRHHRHLSEMAISAGIDLVFLDGASSDNIRVAKLDSSHRRLCATATAATATTARATI